MRYQYKNEGKGYGEFWKGIKYDVPLCCIIFFEFAWHGILREDIPEYSEEMCHLTNNAGVIMCPECTIKKLKSIIKARKIKQTKHQVQPPENQAIINIAGLRAVSQRL